MDIYELNEVNIDIINLIHAFKNIKTNVYKIDFDYVDWAFSIKKKYDLCFCLGIVYHMENPVLFLRNLYEITNKYAVIESDTPLITESFRGNGGYFMNRDQVTLTGGNIRQLLEMRPNRKALIDTLLFVGFKKVSVIEQDPNITSTYFISGEKSILFAEK